MLLNFLVANCLAIAASAHVIMTHPTPFGLSTLQNGPLQPDGSDFPCKLRDGVYDVEGASNVYAQGSTQYLAFRGSAVHGGGSCQISVTTDLRPDKNSHWKVIKSIEGGCPARGEVGNLPGDYSVIDPYTYNYTIPSELPAGSYTMAWTWFNKIGIREMYMNCAPLNVTGYGGSKDYLDTLPDMFEANIFGNGGCGTDESGTDLVFPNPGKDVVRLNGYTSAWAAPTGPCAKASSPPIITTPPSPPPTIPTPILPPPIPIIISIPPVPPVPSIPAIISSVAKPSATHPVQSKPATTTTHFLTAPTPNPQPASGGPGFAPPVSDGAYPVGGACTPEGQWNCVGSHSFQRCASGSWSPVQPLATGMKCHAGLAAELRLITRRSKHALREALREHSQS